MTSAQTQQPPTQKAQIQKTPNLTLPVREGSVRFAVMGDTGTGSRSQMEVGQRMAEYHRIFPFAFVIMVGDNLYGGENSSAFEKKFEKPYKALLDAGVKFYAALGNHDERNQRFYEGFNMDGETYYTFKPPNGSIRFFALESDYMDQKQIDWLDKELTNSNSDWKICFFHHPIYSSGGRHGSDLTLRAALEPLFLKHGVGVVFAGHEHFYERVKPQKGIYYFTVGGSAKLREGDIGAMSPLTAKGFDTDNSFMLVEIDGDEMHFQTISRPGKTIDSGVIPRRTSSSETAGAAPATARDAVPR